MPITLRAMTTKRAAKTSDDRRYFKEVRFRQIRALVETAKHSSFAEASRRLGMSTPSVWRQVRALEDDYGVQLATARGQDVRLTEDGERLVELAVPLVEGFDSLKKVFADQHGNAERNLRVAAPATVLNSSLRDPIASYQRAHPHVKLQLIDAPSRDAWNLLADDKADLAIVGLPPGVELPGRFDVVPLTKFGVQAACLATHPFAKIKKPTLRDLLKQPLILAGEATSSRMQFDRIVSKAGLSQMVNVRVTANNLSLILNYVVVGMGVALITRPAREASPLPHATEKKLVFRDMSHVLGHEQVVLLTPRSRYEPPHVRAFREVVVKGLNEGG